MDALPCPAALFFPFLNKKKGALLL
jgi:hypothetical protein